MTISATHDLDNDSNQVIKLKFGPIFKIVIFAKNFPHHIIKKSNEWLSSFHETNTVDFKHLMTPDLYLFPKILSSLSLTKHLHVPPLI